VKKLTVDLVRKRFGYDPETGILTRLVSSQGVSAGAIGGSLYGGGYLRACVAGRQIPAHRLIWFWMTGEWPKRQIDHINRNKTDNRWCNLREATNSQNGINSPMKANNISGFHGVHFDRWRQKWGAKIRIAGKRVQLGRFASPERAFIAYILAAWKHHGEFANIDANYIRAVKERRKLQAVVLWNLARPDPNYMAVAGGA
jgi:hypothetical protein